jgi:hypothetical protein
MTNKLTLLISTCDKFSDLWEIHCRLLEENWPQRNIRTILLTDQTNSFTFPGIEIISIIGSEGIVDRLRYVVNMVSTEYILITLDDYFLVRPVKNEKIKYLLSLMESEHLDYLRLYKYPKSRKIIPINGAKRIKLLSFDKRYDVNLYPGIWRVSFLKQTLNYPGQDIWGYEVSLTKTAMEKSAKCGWCRENVFPILDVIRKGKFLHKSKRFVKRYGYYTGSRQTISWKEELMLWIMRTVNTYFPDRIRVILKSIMKRRGMKFYSDE